MEQLFPDLWQTKRDRPFFGVTTHAYVLTREDGNIMLYGTGTFDDFPVIQKLGGIFRQYLSHRDEAGPPLVKIKESFGSQLCCHSLEAEVIQPICPVDITFDTRESHLGGDLEVIPTPGHTNGSTCYFYKSPHGKSYLFTGDSIFPKLTSWGTLINSGSGGRASDLRKSLAILRDLAPNVVISSASVGRSSVQQVSPAEWQKIIDKAINSLS
jgi:hypothetical protein